MCPDIVHNIAHLKGLFLLGLGLVSVMRHYCQTKFLQQENTTWLTVETNFSTT